MQRQRMYSFLITELQFYAAIIEFGSLVHLLDRPSFSICNCGLPFSNAPIIARSCTRLQTYNQIRSNIFCLASILLGR